MQYFQFALVIAVITLRILKCDDTVCSEYPDFRYMSRKTDYILVANITNFDQYIVDGMIDSLNMKLWIVV